MSAMFEKATRQNLMFESAKGNLSVQDVWNLSLTSTNPNTTTLDSVAKTISRKLKETGEESFVTKSSKASEELELKLEIVKHIIQVRLTEEKAKRDLVAKKEQASKIAEIIDRKQDQALEGKTLEELQSMLKTATE